VSGEPLPAGGDWVAEAMVPGAAPPPALGGPVLQVGDRQIFVTQRPVEPWAEALPAARTKLITAELGDRSKLVTLVVSHQRHAPDVDTLNIVSTEPGGLGTVLAQGYGRRDQPTILVFKLSS
jgi:hypothetical protein